jgi:hypothetical protein
MSATPVPTVNGCAQNRCRIEIDVPQVELEKFLPELLLSAPGCPQEIAASYVRQAAIDMAESSSMLRRIVRVDLQAGVQSYLVEPPDCVRTIGITRVINSLGGNGQGFGFGVGGYRMVPDDTPIPFDGCLTMPLGCCGGAFPDGGGGFGIGTGYGYGPPVARFTQPNELLVSPIPQCDGDLGLRVELIVAPTRETCTLDRVYYDRYAPALVSGALMYLYRLPKQDWTDYNLGQKMETEFKKWTTKAAGDRLLGAARGPFRLVTPRIL